MFNNGLPDSLLFYCISLLCLPHCLPPHMTSAICYSVFYALCTMSIHCTVPLLCISTSTLCLLCHTSNLLHNDHRNSNNNNHLISSLYRVYIASMHLVHTIFDIPMHSHTVTISSTSRVLCVIIIVTLKLLWPFSHAFNFTVCYTEIPQPLWQFETLRLLCESRTHLLYFSYRPQCSSIFNRLHEHLHPSQSLFTSSVSHPEVSSHPLVETINGF
jgi:hypothetical protein